MDHSVMFLCLGTSLRFTEKQSAQRNSPTYPKSYRLLALYIKLYASSCAPYFFINSPLLSLPLSLPLFFPPIPLFSRLLRQSSPFVIQYKGDGDTVAVCVRVAQVERLAIAPRVRAYARQVCVQEPAGWKNGEILGDLKNTLKVSRMWNLLMIM